MDRVQSPQGPCIADRAFDGLPYLKQLKKLEHSFPALKSFLAKVGNVDAGRKLVHEHYETHQRVPGRCHVLEFLEAEVQTIKGYEDGLSPQALAEYLRAYPSKQSRAQGQRRLFILEDMNPEYVDVLGGRLGVDPLIFAEQMNTWNFSDSRSVPHRGLPSVSCPEQSYTLRYYELRTLQDPKSISRLSAQMTFAVNRRKYERWRDIDVPSFGTGIPDSRHGFVRRSASFWSSQSTDHVEATQGWDTLILVDPSMVSACDKHKNPLILRDPTKYENRAALWDAKTWKTPQDVQATPHATWAYHDGCATLATKLFSLHDDDVQSHLGHFHSKRDMASPLDEQVFYWTKLASSDLIEKARERSSNCAYFLLKQLAQHWVSQLELINCTLAKGEYLSDDFQAKIDAASTSLQWKSELEQINDINKDINYLRRQMNHFWRAMFLNLERLGVQLGDEKVNESLPLALQDAQKDFLTINARLKPLRERVNALGAMANDLAALRAAFKGIQDSDFGMRLSIFASIIFPLTLVASIMSMGDDFLPGKRKFWIFWVASVPPAVLFATVLVYGRRPDRVFQDIAKAVAPKSGLNRRNIPTGPSFNTDVSRWSPRAADSYATSSKV